MVYYGDNKNNLFHAFTMSLFTTDFSPSLIKNFFSLRF